MGGIRHGPSDDPNLMRLNGCHRLSLRVVHRISLAIKILILHRGFSPVTYVSPCLLNVETVFAERLMHEHTETVETVEDLCVTDGHRAKAIAES